MIVPMKKVTLLCMAQDQDATLHALRGLGLLHLTPVQEPGGEDLSSQQQLRAAAAEAATLLSAVADKPEASQGDTGTLEPGAVVEQTHALAAERKQFQDERDRLLRAKSACEPYGDFDPASVRQLADQGVTVKLYRIPPKHDFAEPEGVLVHPLGEDANGRRIAVIGCGDFEVDADEFPLPEQSLAAVCAALAGVEEKTRAVDAKLAALSASLPAVEAHIAALDEHIHIMAHTIQRTASLGDECP